MNRFITLYSALEPDAPVEAYVSRSVGILDQGEPILLSDAIVWAEDGNGLVLDTLQFIGFGQYRSPNLTGVAGNTYVIHASHTALPSAFGRAKIPSIPNEGAVDSVDAFMGNFGGPGPGSRPYVEYSFEIIDDGEAGLLPNRGLRALARHHDHSRILLDPGNRRPLGQRKRLWSRTTGNSASTSPMSSS